MSSAPWSPPERFDGFTIVRALGRGGMGRVYLAREDVVDRLVAIKLMADELHGPDAISRFGREARALARVGHVNVVRIYRLGTVERRPYIAYELVTGEPLDRLVPARSSWRTALHVGRGLAGGLAAVHRAGVLHRDIKPSNVMINADGVVKLLDFGLAKLTDGEAPPPIATAAAPAIASGDELTLTLPGGPRFPPLRTGTSLLMGTPRYMAPELWSGGRASMRSDLYAAGLVLYELTGVARGELGGALPPLADVHDEVPSELGEAIDRCVAIDPAARFASADELAQALARVPQESRKSRTRPPPSTPPATSGR